MESKVGVMYSPKHFSQEDELKIRKLIENHSFATVLSYPDGEKPFINHLPLIFSSSPGAERVLIGHMAKQNPQWRHFRSNPECTLIFVGDHTYITPSWYKSGRDVPTWNYAVVHLHGKIELVDSFDGQVDVLKQLTRFFEKSNANPWDFELPSDLRDQAALTAAIVSFQFHTEKIEAKFKLSQNRSSEDRNGIIDGLSERTDDKSRGVRAMMTERLLLRLP